MVVGADEKETENQANILFIDKGMFSYSTTVKSTPTLNQTSPFSPVVGRNYSHLNDLSSIPGMGAM